MKRDGFAAVILIIIVVVLIAGIVIWYVIQGKNMSAIPSSQTHQNTIVASGTAQTVSSALSDWPLYKNMRYNYSFSYPSAYILGSDKGGDPAQSNVAYLAPLNQDPIFVCAADNKDHWTSGAILDEWIKNTSPDFDKCLARSANGVPSYVQSNDSSPIIAGISAHEVVNVTSNRYEAICDYMATSKTILAICLPQNDIKNSSWDQNLSAYRKILASLKID